MGAALVLALAVVVGTTLQRLSGTGVGLVVAPVLAILLGPAYGVTLTNMTTVVSGFMIMITVWASISWRRYFRIMPAAIIGAWPGAWLVGQLPESWLAIILGFIVLAALVVTVSLRTLPHWTGRLPAFIAGFCGGFFNTTSGVAAPVMVTYSRVSQWDQRSFAATLQPIFMTMGLMSVISKAVLNTMGPAPENAVSLGWAAVVVVSSVAVGIICGGLLARRVPVSIARNLALALAGLGGVAAVVRGVFMLLA